MRTLPFSQVPHGSYFRSAFTNALFVKYDDFEANPVKMDGLIDPHAFGYDFDPETPTLYLDCDSEWPAIDYKPEIQGWNWEAIKARMSKTFILTEEGEPYEAAWVGTTIGVMPSGKIYTAWTSNQTEEDINKDQYYYQALHEVCEAQGVFPDWNDGDLSLCKATTFEAIATASGYEVRKNDFGYFWTNKEEDSILDGYLDDEEAAWEGCCKYNNLVQ